MDRTSKAVEEARARPPLTRAEKKSVTDCRYTMVQTSKKVLKVYVRIIQSCNIFLDALASVESVISVTKP